MALDAITYEKMSPKTDDGRDCSSIQTRDADNVSFYRLLLVVVILLCCLALSTFRPPLPLFGERQKPGPAHPVILIPGDGGTQVEAKLNKTSGPHYFCARKTNYWFDLWVNIELIGPLLLDCFIDNMRLEYDNSTRMSASPEGVQIRFPGFGNTSEMDFLDPSHLSPTSYFQSISDALVAEAGLIRGVSLRGAPYDFRLGPTQQDKYFAALKKLIETTYTNNGNLRVMLVAHSMGNPMTHLFLTRQTQDWRDKFIHSFVSLAPPWGGAVKSVKVMTSGDSLGIFIVSTFKSRKYQRTMSSLPWLMPKPSFWKPDEVLVMTQKRNYTVSDYEALFRDMGWETGWEMYKDQISYGADFAPPGVENHNYYGVNVTTASAFLYSYWFPFPDNKPYEIAGNGDGTVNIRSLEGWRRWVGKQKQFVNGTGRQGVNHMTILDDKFVISEIVRFSSGKPIS